VRALPWKLARLTLAFTCSILATIIFSGVFPGGVGENTVGAQWVTGLLVLLCAVAVGVLVYRKLRIWS
jgi:hypothetical protein